MNNSTLVITVALFLLCAFLVICGVLTSAAAKQSERPATWPPEPVKISPTEGVIESFWNSSLKAPTRLTSENGTLSKNWDACFFNMQVDSSGGEARMSRAYRLELGDYQRLRIRLRPGQGVKTTIVAEVDGEEQVVAEKVAASHDAMEIAGPVHGRQLTGLTLKFSVDRDASVLPPDNEARSKNCRAGLDSTCNQ